MDSHLISRDDIEKVNTFMDVTDETWTWGWTGVKGHLKNAHRPLYYGVFGGW